MHALTLLCASLASICAVEQTIYIGTYTRTGASQGIYSLRFAPDGSPSPAVLAATLPDPTWLCWSPNRTFLYALGRDVLVAYARAADGALTERSRQPIVGRVPCAGEVDPSGRMLVVATYVGGTVESFPLDGIGGIAPSVSSIALAHASRIDPKRQEKPHAHGVTWTPDGRHVLVPDLGADRIYIYAADPTTGRLVAHAQHPWLDLAPGSGPRHAVFSPDGRQLYVIGELDCSITVCTWDAATATGTPVARSALRSPDATGEASGAEVLVHPGGGWVYATVRGDDTVCALPRDAQTGLLGPVLRTPCGGRTPRHAALAAAGALLFCGHQDDGTIEVFRTGPGPLEALGRIAGIAQPVCILVP